MRLIWKLFAFAMVILLLLMMAQFSSLSDSEIEIVRQRLQEQKSQPVSD